MLHQFSYFKVTLRGFLAAFVHNFQLQAVHCPYSSMHLRHCLSFLLSATQVISTVHKSPRKVTRPVSATVQTDAV